jgi:hypothetical protein
MDSDEKEQRKVSRDKGKIGSERKTADNTAKT